MKVQDQPAYILHQRPYRDTSQIVELFSRDYGRLSAVSRGSRGPRSRLRAIMQPFRPLTVSWSGKGEMPTLTGAEATMVKLPMLVGKALPSAFYINELVMRLLHRFDVQEEIYHLYEDTLYRLRDIPQLEACLRLFEKQLLEYLGFALNLSSDADSGEAVDADAQYIYYVEHGPVRTPGGVHEGSQPLLGGASLQAFDQGDLESEQVRREIKSLMRYVLAFYLDGKPLKSRELFR